MAILLPAGAAFAQAAPLATVPAQPATANGKSDQAVAEVVVTGSRIARRDYTSNSPIVTVTSQSLMTQADLQIQSSLNKLPEFSPDQNMTGRDNTGDHFPTPTHSVGISTASLRGLGPNRNLVLIDGERGAPVNGELVIDLNTIPTAMVDHVEVITGGASAVYGADAVGGVLNFVMKKNFQGLDLDMQEGINQAGGDGKQFSVSAIMGTNFADNRGNMTISLERFTQDPTLEKNHAWVTKGWNDPTVSPVNGFPFGTEFTPLTSNPISASAVASVFPNAPAGSIPLNTAFWFQGNSVYTGMLGTGAVAPGGVSQNPNAVNGTTVAYANAVNPATGKVVQLIKNNEDIGDIQTPLDRWSMFANGHYDINDWVTATFQANFAETHTTTHFTQYPPSFLTGWTVNIPYDQATNGVASGHPVPAALATLLNSRTNPNAPWQLNWLPNVNTGILPPWGTDDTNTVWQIRAGLKGKFPGGSNWNWSLDGSHSDSMEYTVATGEFSLTRLQALFTANNYGQGTFQGNYYQPNGNYYLQPPPANLATQPGVIVSPNANYGNAKVSCTTGFYNTLFNGAAPSADCLAAVNAPLQSMDITTQDVVEFDTSGDLFQLPAGTVKASLGADYRRDALIFNPDILGSNQSFTDQVVGVYPAAYSNVSQDVKEGYGELSIPILANLPFIKSLTLNPGLRYSSYNRSKGGFTYKILGDYELNDWVRLRGGYNLAVRAPNLGELYEGLTEVFGPGSSYGDPCSLLSTAPYGAGGSQATVTGLTAPVANKGGLAGAQNALQICKNLMGAQSAQYYYNTTGVTQPAPGPSAVGWVNVQGNPNLLPETAKTFTAGAVLKSPLQNPLFSRITVSVDYYKIHIDNAIEFTSVDYVYQQCLTQPVATAAASIYCQAAQRTPLTGGEALTTTPAANLATIDTSGVDLQLDWSFALEDLRKNLPGRFSLSMVANFLGNYDTISGPGQAVQRWYGTLGPTLTGTNGGAYRYKLNTTFGYSIGPATFNLNWRHLPQVNAATAVAPGNSTLPTSAYDIFDLTTNWTLPHGLQLRAGIQNLFDAQPPTTAATNAVYVNGVQQTVASSGAGYTNPAFYDPFGRRFFVGLKARF
ncbi:MAG TPA: TonB-dependent receptor [Caulobacteraceae bacterium]